MKKISFPEDKYCLDTKTNTWNYKKTEESIVGKLELIWGAIQFSTLTDLKQSDHKSNKKLKKAIRNITIFKGPEEDSRISAPGAQVLLLEDSEYNLLMRHLKEGNIFTSKVSEDLSDLYDILESAETKTLTSI